MLQYVTFYVFTNKDAFEFYVLLSGSSSGYHTAGLDSFCKMLHTQLRPEDEGNNNKWENHFRLFFRITFDFKKVSFLH